MFRLLSLLFLALMFSQQPAMADDNRPLSVFIEAEGPDHFEARWKIPVNVEARHIPQLTADGCEVISEQRNWSDPMGHWGQEKWSCPDGLAGAPVNITYPQSNPNLATIVRFFPAGGAEDKAEAQTVLMQPEVDQFSLAVAGEEKGSFLDFLTLGIEHIWMGFDHLLFVAGLIFIARTPRRILATITSFTIAHSITLALSALDIMRLPISAIEGVIALSIVFLGVEIVKGPRESLTWRKPIVVASAFGLLHGFGFAAVLREIGLPDDGFFTALLAFNLGIEIGQIVFAMLVIGGFYFARQTASRFTSPIPVVKLGGYGIGTLASFWMFDRLL